MRPVEVRAAIAQLAASQWGLITAAQATAAGATRMLLTRMTDSGELDRVIYGVYAVPTALADEHLEKRALWLSLDPGRTAEERLATRHEAGVLSHATAAALHGIGDILDDRVEITSPRRQQTRRAELRLHRAVLRPDEVTYVEGLPTTTASRTIADLIAAGHDRDHVATVLADALRQDLSTPEQISEALERRLGADQADQVLAELLTTAGLDETSLEKAVISSPIGHRAIENMAIHFGQTAALRELGDFTKWYSSIAPHIDVSALKTLSIPKVPSLQNPEMLRTAALASDLVRQLGATDAIKQVMANAQLVENLQRFAKSHYAHLPKVDLTPLLAQRAGLPASVDPAAEPAADTPDEPGHDEEADQEQ